MSVTSNYKESCFRSRGVDIFAEIHTNQEVLSIFGFNVFELKDTRYDNIADTNLSLFSFDNCRVNTFCLSLWSYNHKIIFGSRHYKTFVLKDGLDEGIQFFNLNLASVFSTKFEGYFALDLGRVVHIVYV